MQISKDSPIYSYYSSARRTNLDNYKIGAILTNESMIVGLNKVQMRLGQTASGTPITPKYSRGYNRLKLQMNTFKAPSMTPDLYLTGSLQKGMKLKFGGSKTYSFFSSDAKAEKVFGRYKGVLGLQQINKDKAKIKVTNLFLKRVYEAIHKR